MKLLILAIIIVMSSCSTLKKSIIYPSLVGAVTGAAAGVLLSPDRESRNGNASVFGVLGAGAGAFVGYALYEDDPRNYKLKHMLGRKKKKIDPNELELNLGDIVIDAKLDKKEAYKVPVKNLPKELKGKVNKQFLIKYQSKERYVKKGSKTFYIPSFQVFEHAYDDQMKGHSDD